MPGEKKGRPVRPADMENIKQAVRPPQPNLRHGIYTFLSQGVLPEGFEHVLAEADEWHSGLLSDEAQLDASDPNHKRRMLVDSAVRSYVVCRLGFEDLLRRGFLVEEKKGSKTLNPVLKVVGTFENTLRLALTSLGLERRQRQVPDLQEYLHQREAEDGEEGKS